MAFSTFITLAAILLSSMLPSANAQCANNVAIYNPLLRTMSSNRQVPRVPSNSSSLTQHSTWFIIPVPKSAVQDALKQAFPLQQLSLLDVPASDSTLFPNGFPAGMHPVLATIGLTDDIRMSALQIDGGLKQGATFATYVSQNGNPTPLSASLANYIAGEEGPLPNGLVPAVASPLLFAGVPLRLGQFNPDAPAYASDDAGTLTSQAKWAVLPNPISGPGVYPEAFDFLFRKQPDAQKYTAKTFKTLINQPTILPSGLCQRNQAYFTNATALTSFTFGDVTLGPAASGLGVLKGALMQASPDGSGLYKDNEGFTGCAQSVGFTPETCEAAGTNLDPAALD